MDTYYWTLSCSIWTWFVSPFVLSVLQKFSMLLRAHVKLCLTELDFLVKFLYSKKWSKWLRNGSFQLFENSCHQFSLKMFSKCFQDPPVQTRCLGKFLFLSLGTNYSQPIRLQDSLEESPNWLTGFLRFLSCNLLYMVTGSQKRKIFRPIFFIGVVRHA